MLTKVFEVVSIFRKTRYVFLNNVYFISMCGKVLSNIEQPMHVKHEFVHGFGPRVAHCFILRIYNLNLIYLFSLLRIIFNHIWKIFVTIFYNFALIFCIFLILLHIGDNNLLALEKTRKGVVEPNKLVCCHLFILCNSIV